MGRPKTPSESTAFPKWVALGCLAFGLWQFLSNTVPALREREVLQNLAGDLMQLRRQYDDAILQTRLGVGENAHCDLQAVLVAIDQLGYTPAELCAAFPETSAAAGENGR